MRSLVITTPASDTSILTLDEMRQAAGVKNASRDAELRGLAARITASIMAECNIAIGSGAEPTLRRETLTETIYEPNNNGSFTLSRRHDVVITSLTLDGAAVAPEDYFVESESGLIYRLPWPQYDYLCQWWRQTAVVVYDAGFAIVPGDLKQAALDFFRSSFAEADRDPYAKSISKDVPGVGSKTIDYWVGSIPGQSNEGPVPDIVAGQLKRFRNFVIG